jgi:hypothetical protein
MAKRQLRRTRWCSVQIEMAAGADTVPPFPAAGAVEALPVLLAPEKDQTVDPH